MTASAIEPGSSGLGVFFKQRRRQLPAGATAIGPHLRLDVRVGRPVTQEEIAEAIGVSRVWYATIESGRCDVSPKLLTRIADALMLGPEERLALLRLAFPAFANFQSLEAS